MDETRPESDPLDDWLALTRALGAVPFELVEETAQQMGVATDDLLDLLQREGVQVDASEEFFQEQAERAEGEDKEDWGRDQELAEPLRVLLSQIGIRRLLNLEEEIFLAQRAQEGDGEARRLLIEANIPLVIKIASEFHRRGLPSLEDMVQDGCIGLIRAVDRYDWRKGYRLGTYAVWWIRQQILRGLAEQTRLIRIPYPMVETLSQLNRASHQLRQELGREPTVEELAGETGLSQEQIREALSVVPTITSLEAPVGEEEDLSVEEVLADPTALSPETEFLRSLARRHLLELLEVLTEREREVLKLRYGLIDGKTRTLEEVSRILRITQEGARHLESRGLAKLRDPQYRQILNLIAQYL
ncbi:MAG: sigma-70 family RNA polymerase sigma factor [Armatimonadetes bacterium]|nr:sigma-70 family RNA polymerase sigma factor [Armatimonadota bacterium]MDW8121843.1 sigma-70 family RNA polymerase sigma factor [Armatimonadota bacterium]